MSRICYVFIPGGTMSNWVWRDVAPQYLSNAILVDRRLKENDCQSRLHSSLGNCVDYVEELISSSRSERFALIAHSGGGLLAPLVAKRFPGRCEAIVFVSANIPRNGATSMSELPGPMRLLNRIAAKTQLRSDSFPARKLENGIRKRFCNTSSPQVIDYILEQQLLPEPLCAFTEKVNWTDVPKVRMAYIRLLNDKTASTAAQDRMSANLSITEKYDIDSDHMVMLSHPREFNLILQKVFERESAA